MFKRWQLVLMLLCSITAIAILTYRAVNSSGKVEIARVLERENIKPKEVVVEDTSTDRVIFEVKPPKEEMRQSEDIEVLPDNFNGEYLTDDGSTLKDLAEHPVARVECKIDADDRAIMYLDEKDAWTYVSNGLLTDYEKRPYSEVANIYQQIQKETADTITVKVWTWANANDSTDLSKVTKEINLTVNTNVADLFIKAFDAIYRHETKPVINLNDYGMGTWCLRGKNHNPNNTPSAHALGCAIDLNPSSGSVNVDGVLYGNGYGNKTMPYSIWRELPDTQTKYNVLYQGCPIVEAFKSYGFYWGGDWTGTADPMHLGYVGDYGGRADVLARR